MNNNPTCVTCPVFNKCGSCSYIGTPYEKQLNKKQEDLEKMLGEFLPVPPIIGMKDPLHYRNKVHHVFANTKKGIISGSYMAGSHYVINIEHCFLEDEKSQQIIHTIRQLLKSFKISIYDEDSGRGSFRHVLIRSGYHSKEYMVVLVMASQILPGKNNFIKALRKEHPEITTIILNVNDRDTSFVLGNRNIVLYGKGYITDTLLKMKYRISPASFYQVNPVQTEVLYSLVDKYCSLTGNETVIDAYCGVGTIGLSLAGKAGKIIGIELNKDAVNDARINARENHLENASFYQGDAGDFLDTMASKKEKADIIIMDPPRCGSTPKFLDSVNRIRPKKLIYVSCDPETLARDLHYLKKLKWEVQKIQPVDMFPMTDHVETVCLLSKLSEVKNHISVKVDMNEMDLTAAESKATYQEIKEWVKEKYGFYVSHLNIAKTKRKCGIIERQNYNLPKSEDGRSPETPKEKEEAIIAAFKAFRMI